MRRDDSSEACFNQILDEGITTLISDQARYEKYCSGPKSYNFLSGSMLNLHNLAEDIGPNIGDLNSNIDPKIMQSYDNDAPLSSKSLINSGNSMTDRRHVISPYLNNQDNSNFNFDYDSNSYLMNIKDLCQIYTNKDVFNSVPSKSPHYTKKKIESVPLKSRAEERGDSKDSVNENRSSALKKILEEIKADSNLQSNLNAYQACNNTLENPLSSIYHNKTNLKESRSMSKEFSDTRSLDFNDVRYEMNTIQTKLHDMELKFLDKKNISNISISRNNESQSKITKDKSIKQDNLTANKNVMSLSFSRDNSISKFEKKDKPVSSLISVKSKDLLDKSKANRDNLRPKSKSSALSRIEVETKKTSRSVSKGSSFTSLNTEKRLEEKYKLLKINYDALKSDHKLQIKTNAELTRKIKNMIKKEEAFDKINSEHKKAVAMVNKLDEELNQSELIRKEQARLIKSLQKEVELLRQRSDVHDDTTTNNSIGRPISKSQVEPSQQSANYSNQSYSNNSLSNYKKSEIYITTNPEKSEVSNTEKTSKRLNIMKSLSKPGLRKNMIPQSAKDSVKPSINNSTSSNIKGIASTKII